MWLVGEGLNHPAIITFYGALAPGSGDAKSVQRYEKNLRKAAEKMEVCRVARLRRHRWFVCARADPVAVFQAKFVQYSSETGTLVVSVSHFSRYNFSNVDEGSDSDSEDVHATEECEYPVVKNS